MSGDNGKKTPEQEKPTEPKVVLQVIMKIDGSFEMKTSLIPPMVNWVLDQIKYNLIKRHTEPELPEKKIVPAKGGMINFARRKFG